MSHFPVIGEIKAETNKFQPFNQVENFTKHFYVSIKPACDNQKNIHIHTGIL